MEQNIENTGDIIIYQTEDGLTKINVKLDNETVWLNQQQLVLLYQSSKSNISEHIKHIFAEGELDEKSVVRKFRTTADDGKNYEVTYYNLDMIISLGYRIKSTIATRFRIWATQRLKEYMIKGSVSHAQALEKAINEYRKYQSNTLSPVEEAYLETVKETAKLVKKNTKGKKQ